MSAVYSGEVRNGVVVFDGTCPLPPEGTRVRVELVSEGPDDLATPTLAERLQPVIGMAKGLPRTWRPSTITTYTASPSNDSRLGF